MEILDRTKSIHNYTQNYHFYSDIESLLLLFFTFNHQDTIPLQPGVTLLRQPTASLLHRYTAAKLFSPQQSNIS